MNMRWLVAIAGIEEESVWSNSQYGWHCCSGGYAPVGLLHQPSAISIQRGPKGCWLSWVGMRVELGHLLPVVCLEALHPALAHLFFQGRPLHGPRVGWTGADNPIFLQAGKLPLAETQQLTQEKLVVLSQVGGRPWVSRGGSRTSLYIRNG